MTDWIGMYLQGCAFSDCANLCNYEAGSGGESIAKFELSTPAIVNCAFACEILLKLLLAIDQKSNIRCHKLKDLFDLLPTEIQKRINDKLYIEYGFVKKNDFGIEYLQLISDAFTDWRYKYEKMRLSIDVGFIFSFCSILKIECERRLGIDPSFRTNKPGGYLWE